MRARDAMEWTVPILGLIAGVMILVSLRTSAPRPPIPSAPEPHPEIIARQDTRVRLRVDLDY